jgi:hypothetical protein
MATMTFGLSGSIVNSNKTYSGSDTDLTGLLQWTSAAYRASIQSKPPTVSFTGSISGTTLTVTATASGNFGNNQFIYGTGVLDGTYITGGSGPTYTVSRSQTVPSGAMTAYGPDIVATGLYESTRDAWIQAQQKFVKDINVSNVPTPPPMGWT